MSPSIVRYTWSDFVNLKISRHSFFEVVIEVGCTYMFVGMSICAYMNIYVSIVFLKTLLVFLYEA
jgi:hypothetical protein